MYHPLKLNPRAVLDSVPPLRPSAEDHGPYPSMLSASEDRGPYPSMPSASEDRGPRPSREWSQLHPTAMSSGTDSDLPFDKLHHGTPLVSRLYLIMAENVSGYLHNSRDWWLLFKQPPNRDR